MIKMMILAPRRPTFTHAGFRDYVLNTHGPLVKSIEEVAAGIRRYHYNFPIPGATETVFGHPHAEGIDIFTQAWFDSLAAHRDNQKHPRYMQVIRPDEEVMADNARALFHYMHEHDVVPGPFGTTKVFFARRRRAGLTRSAFHRGWADPMADAVAHSPHFAQVVQRYVQNQALPEADHPDGTDPKFFDVIDEFAVARADDWAVLAQDHDFIARVRAAEAEWTQADRTVFYIAQTCVNIAAPHDA